MTPAERLAALDRLDRVIRERNTWTDMRALGAYEDLWEIAYGMAHQAVQVSEAARRVVEQDIAAEPDFTPFTEEALTTTQESFEAQKQAIDSEVYQREVLGMWPPDAEQPEEGAR